MSTRKQREILRQRRMQFDAQVADNRAEREQEERLDAMTKAQLIEYAGENGIAIDKTAKKAEILSAIKEG